MTIKSRIALLEKKRQAAKGEIIVLYTQAGIVESEGKYHGLPLDDVRAQFGPDDLLINIVRSSEALNETR